MFSSQSKYVGYFWECMLCSFLHMIMLVPLVVYYVFIYGKYIYLLSYVLKVHWIRSFIFCYKTKKSHLCCFYSHMAVTVQHYDPPNTVGTAIPSYNFKNGHCCFPNDVLLKVSHRYRKSVNFMSRYQYSKY
jgi:hypothetical protein